MLLNKRGRRALPLFSLCHCSSSSNGHWFHSVVSLAVYKSFFMSFSYVRARYAELVVVVESPCPDVALDINSHRAPCTRADGLDLQCQTKERKLRIAVISVVPICCVFSRRLKTHTHAHVYPHTSMRCRSYSHTRTLPKTPTNALTQ